MNIILVVIDTLRYDHVGANGNDWIRTPNLDAFAETAWCFDWAFQAWTFIRGGEGAFPKAACPSPLPAGYHAYWNNSLKQW